MSLRFRSQLQIDNLPDQMLESKFEVLMPAMDLLPKEKLDSRMTKLASSALPKYYPIVEEINFGFQNFATDMTRINTFYFCHPRDKQPLKNVTITLYLDDGMLAWYYLQSWKDLMFNEEYEYYYSPANYKKNITVLFYGAGSLVPNARFTLKGCFPLETSEFKLQYKKNPDPLRLTQTFSVDRVEVDYDYGAGAVISTLTSNGLGYAADQLAALGTDTAFRNTSA